MTPVLRAALLIASRLNAKDIANSVWAAARLGGVNLDSLQVCAEYIYFFYVYFYILWVVFAPT